MQQKINLTRVICLRIEKPTPQKIPSGILRLPHPRVYYYQNKRLQGILVPYTNL